MLKVTISNNSLDLSAGEYSYTCLIDDTNLNSTYKFQNSMNKVAQSIIKDRITYVTESCHKPIESVVTKYNINNFITHWLSDYEITSIIEYDIKDINKIKSFIPQILNKYNNILPNNIKVAKFNTSTQTDHLTQYLKYCFYEPFSSYEDYRQNEATILKSLENLFIVDTNEILQIDLRFNYLFIDTTLINYNLKSFNNNNIYNIGDYNSIYFILDKVEITDITKKLLIKSFENLFNIETLKKELTILKQLYNIK